MESNWSRPIDVSFPKIWYEFKAKESKHSDRLVKYWIQDLPEDRFDDALQHIEDYFLPDAPISKYFGAPDNTDYVQDYLRPCRLKLPNKTSLVCFREGSNEIVGFSLHYVATKNNGSFWSDIFKSAKSDEYKEHMNIAKICGAKVDAFEKYNIDEYMRLVCLSVAQNYRGLRIGQRLLEASASLCNALGIKLIQSFFISDYSNYIADKVGFQTDSQYTTDELNAIYPKIPFHQMNTKTLAFKSWNFQNIYDS